MVATNKVQKKKEKVQEANAADIALAAERVINDDKSFISDGELLEVCCFKQLDTDLMEATATDSTATGMSAFNESVTHHLNELTFQHEVATNILSTEFINVFTRYCDDGYSSGVSDVNLKDFSKILLKLRSTSLAIVGIIQQTKTNALWKVLFYSGSNKTIVKRMSLPSGMETLTGKKRKICGVNASSTTDQNVLLKDITLPAFSSLQQIPGPIRAIVMDTYTQYDLILGMGVMQAIGLDLHNSSKTIVWNDHRVPFKPHDYFDDA
jgi:hypothetical protein